MEHFLHHKAVVNRQVQAKTVILLQNNKKERKNNEMAELKSNVLSSAEIDVEGNYNMVGDGIINNVPKPSMLERLEELEKEKLERNKDESADDKRERRKADYLNGKDER
jgi:hypothetical protein